jgi:hypothetical protein
MVMQSGKLIHHFHGDCGFSPDRIFADVAAHSSLQLVHKSGLVQEQPLGALLEQLGDLTPAGDEHAQVAKVASAMICRGLLSIFQAEKLLEGKCRGFTIGTTASGNAWRRVTWATSASTSSPAGAWRSKCCVAPIPKAARDTEDGQLLERFVTLGTNPLSLPWWSGTGRSCMGCALMAAGPAHQGQRRHDPLWQAAGRRPDRNSPCQFHVQPHRHGKLNLRVRVRRGQRFASADQVQVGWPDGHRVTRQDLHRQAESKDVDRGSTGDGRVHYGRHRPAARHRGPFLATTTNRWGMDLRSELFVILQREVRPERVEHIVAYLPRRPGHCASHPVAFLLQR